MLPVFHCLKRGVGSWSFACIERRVDANMRLHGTGRVSGIKCCLSFLRIVLA